ncbi:plant virulence effector HPE1-like domain-containing protein [Pararhizobium sp. BT-229]|uniref:plant virulence effector HPE1-like domain-containing protein n=1 Tax=Pararhizobium sp. BT-229 TaxID=2986923 RepID=UPI0021F6E96A|nr:plant virulence effector HPE1-like domain-containing protein [Pararhizobium sp. BT-229]MCV9963058.1 plant virulence effector HPE1-like domain-containing protein [Pararhizobium sp. BT-229]
MRAMLFTFASLALAGTAGAASVEVMKTGQDQNHSVSELSCAHCPPPIVKKKTGYIVPEVAAGTDRVELKEINGEMKLVRTEAWLGGSPVVFITKASEDTIKAAHAQQLPPAEHLAKAGTLENQPAGAEATAQLPIIDGTAKTSAVSTATMADMAAVTPQDSQSQEVDLENFQLRLK